MNKDFILITRGDGTDAFIRITSIASIIGYSPNQNCEITLSNGQFINCPSSASSVFEQIAEMEGMDNCAMNVEDQPLWGEPL